MSRIEKFTFPPNGFECTATAIQENFTLRQTNGGKLDPDFEASFRKNAELPPAPDRVGAPIFPAEPVDIALPLNTIDVCPVIPKLLPGEPIFVLRAKDKGAPAAIMQWVNNANLADVPMATQVDAMKIANQMIAWQIAHGTKHPG